MIITRLSEFEFLDCIFYFERVNVQGGKWTYDCESGDAYYLIAVRNKDDGTFWPVNATLSVAQCYGVSHVPLLGYGQYDQAKFTAMAEGDSMFESQSFREGVVIQKMKHQGVPCFLKSVNPQYLAGK